MIGPGEEAAGMECCKQRNGNGKRSQKCGRNEFLIKGGSSRNKRGCVREIQDPEDSRNRE